MAFVKVAKMADVPEGTGITVNVNGTDVAVFNVSGKFYALDNTCLHRGGPLGEGILNGEIVTCPWHAWTYDVITGQGVSHPNIKVATYKVKVESDDVLVSLE